VISRPVEHGDVLTLAGREWFVRVLHSPAIRPGTREGGTHTGGRGGGGGGGKKGKMWGGGGWGGGGGGGGGDVFFNKII
jgi:hypothetical protein